MVALVIILVLIALAGGGNWFLHSDMFFFIFIWLHWSYQDGPKEEVGAGAEDLEGEGLKVDPPVKVPLVPDHPHPVPATRNNRPLAPATRNNRPLAPATQSHHYLVLAIQNNQAATDGEALTAEIRQKQNPAFWAAAL